jgi:hypothetical protein
MSAALIAASDGDEKTRPSGSSIDPLSRTLAWNSSPRLVAPQSSCDLWRARWFSNVVDATEETLRVGARLSLACDKLTDEVELPGFKLA